MRAFLVLAMTIGVAACASSNQKPLSKPQPERASDINLELGVDYFRKGNLAAAKEKIDRAVEQNPRNAKAQAAAGLLYDRLNEPRKSAAHMDKAVSLDPNNPDILNNYAVMLCKRGEHAKGEKYFVRAAENPLYKTPEVAYLNAGNCARAANDLKNAEVHFRKALTVRPRFQEALYQMADLEFQNKSYLSARGFVERFLAAGKSTPSVLWLGVQIENALGNATAANNYGQRLKLEYPSAAETRQLLESERKPG
ncbi:MAG TPA: type IV pilus biogenesis/stability protein PilW [Povalibacter sp.]|uniref:type IV pilus biogenesis/stability protein PilW n=1 Tax=Povalibacter sp. TaxID=1962978 RepID=UPI002CE5667B|nr:type IV pilus biogenesis/stability protein PilW [Povalibacter sp.]HMN43199.1 type IV pilus biogenesis/stability protein PilW [Povalibacter sp.]